MQKKVYGLIVGSANFAKGQIVNVRLCKPKGLSQVVKETIDNM